MALYKFRTIIIIITKLIRAGTVVVTLTK